MRYLLILLLLGLAAGAAALGDDDDATADDDATGDDDETADDDDATGDDDDTSAGDDDDDIGDDDDDSWTPCDEVITALGPDEESPLGFSGDDVVAPIAGPLIATATWSGTGATTDVSFALSVSGDPLFHDLSEPEDPPQGPDFQCLDWLEIPVTADAPRSIFDWDTTELEARQIMIDEHCFGCTAGAGSSCGGETA